jgi:hypothetical protein
VSPAAATYARVDVESCCYCCVWLAAAAGDTVDDVLQLTKQWLGPDADYARISVGGEQDEAAPVTGQRPAVNYFECQLSTSDMQASCLLA